MSSLRYLLAAAGVTAGLVAAAKYAAKKIEGPGADLPEADLTDTSWIKAYQAEFSAAFPDVKFVAGRVRTTVDNVYVWATDTPEWDQEWFERRGWEFPSRWVTLESVDGMQDPVLDLGSGK